MCNLTLKYSLLFSLGLLLTIITPTHKVLAGTLTFGVVPQFGLQKIHEIWDPILGNISIRSGVSLELKNSKSIPEFERNFEDGHFDFLYLNPYHLIIANEAQGYIPIVRDAGRSLFGIIVVRKDSIYKKINQLQGRTIAFPSPNALGAALIPRAEFENKFKLNYKARFVRSHTSVYLNVVLKQADAGGGVYSTLVKQRPEIRDQLRIIYETDKFPPHPVAVHPRVSRKIMENVTSAFLHLGSNEEGRKLLSQIPILRIGPAKLSDYESLKKLGLENYYVRTEAQ